MESILIKTRRGKRGIRSFWGRCGCLCIAILAGLFYLASSQAAGSAPPEDEDEKSELVVFAENISMTIQPKRCLIRASHSQCETTIQLSWKAEKPFTLCLREKGDSLDLGCWEKSVSGAVKVRFEGNKTTYYQLVNQDSKTIAEVAFTVSIVASRHRKVMSRKRRMWGFP